MAFSYSPKIVTDGLVLYLDAANRDSYPGSGTVWNDISRGGNNGTLTNGPIFNTGSLGSIVFDGANDYVRLFNNLILQTSDFCINQWVSASPGLGGFLFTCDGPNSGNCGDNGAYLTSFNTDGTITFRVVGSTNVVLTTSGTVYNNNIPLNITCVKTTSTMFIYVNGILQTSTTSPTSINSVNNNAYFGIRNGTIANPGGCGTSYFNGKLYALSIYSKALSAQEVLQNYNAQKSRFGLT
jgi:hypothetical protein